MHKLEDPVTCSLTLALKDSKITYHKDKGIHVVPFLKKWRVHLRGEGQNPYLYMQDTT